MKFDFFWDGKIGPVFIININNRDYGICLCHRIEERSIRFFGLGKYLCARCLGILLGGIIGIIINRLIFNVPPLFGFLCLLPMLIDGFSQSFGLRQSNNELRLLTGFLFGFGMTPVLNFLFLRFWNV
jgi:uncharacterized membrane protein